MKKPVKVIKASQRLIKFRLMTILIVALLLLSFHIISGGGIGAFIFALFVSLIICMFADKYIVNYEKKTAGKH
jgi:hypothetical protein